MSLFRQTLHKSLVKSTTPRHLTKNLHTSPRLLATEGYGSGDGNPVGENPQAQGKNPSEHIEHPGPEAPSVVNKGKDGNASKDQKSETGQDADHPGRKLDAKTVPERKIGESK